MFDKKKLQKSFKRRFGAQAPQLTVKAHMPTRYKLAIGGVAAVLVAGLIWGGFDYGRILGGFNTGKIEEERKQMRADIALLTEDNAALKKRNVELENDAKIAVGAKEAVSQQLTSLQTEVMQLREESSFFQKLIAGSVKDGSLAIQRLVVQKEPEGDGWRLRALVTRGGSPDGEFRGTLQLTVNAQHDSKHINIVLPDEQKDLADSLKLSFKTYQRVEAVFRVPPGGQVKSVHAKLMANGSNSPRAQLNVTL